ncbi:hypothetical protein PROFUN_03664 [Planoprotostelium fungivorum]|uniref:Uncharacterized protein n=1 Tax=Planoprotostelium fungivorum TaxID=1890364 RepID=A0A2P6NSJ4_9EUKA|nr:hypothetical protein PROFUN_03664 [Planoprotostelium fungivorum]
MSKCQKLVQQVYFLVFWPKMRYISNVTGRKHRDLNTSDNDEALSSTTKVQDKRNHQLAALCSRVEHPFAQIFIYL